MLKGRVIVEKYSIRKDEVVETMNFDTYEDYEKWLDKLLNDCKKKHKDFKNEYIVKDVQWVIWGYRWWYKYNVTFVPFEDEPQEDETFTQDDYYDSRNELMELRRNGDIDERTYIYCVEEISKIMNQDTYYITPTGNWWKTVGGGLYPTSEVRLKTKNLVFSPVLVDGRI